MSFIYFICRKTAKSMLVTDYKCFDAVYHGNMVFEQSITYRQLEPIFIKNLALELQT
jgi:hypothetical protein